MVVFLLVSLELIKLSLLIIYFLQITAKKSNTSEKLSLTNAQELIAQKLDTQKSDAQELDALEIDA